LFFGHALLQLLWAFSQADFALSVVAVERQDVCAFWQLFKQSALEGTCATARNDWTSCGRAIRVSGDIASPAGASDIAKDDAESRAAIAIRVNLVIG
jgi:hypothetical protein